MIAATVFYAVDPLELQFSYGRFDFDESQLCESSRFDHRGRGEVTALDTATGHTVTLRVIRSSGKC